jgi:hypothetical protein
MTKYIISLIVFFCAAFNSFSQEEKSNQVQPTIMVVPYGDTDDNTLATIEDNYEYRSIIDMINRKFDEKGFTTINFIQAVKNARKDNAVASKFNQNVVAQIKANAGSDILIEAEIKLLTGKLGSYVEIRLNAINQYTSQNLGGGINLTSREIRNINYVKLAQMALKDEEVEKFLNIVNEKFAEMRENGRTIKIELRIEEALEFTFEDEVNDGDYYSDLIDDWMNENAYKSYVHIQKSTDTEIIYDEVKIPLIDSKGEPYNPRKMERGIRKYINQLLKDNGIEAKVSRVITNQSILLIIKAK